MKRISWNVSMKHGAVLNTVTVDRDILYTINRRICEWMFPKQVIEEKIQGREEEEEGKEEEEEEEEEGGGGGGGK